MLGFKLHITEFKKINVYGDILLTAEGEDNIHLLARRSIMVKVLGLLWMEYKFILA